MRNSISRRLLAVSVLALVLGLSTPAAQAGSLDVNASAAFSGNFGLEVTPGSACVLPERVDLDSQIVIVDVDACSFLTAVDTVVSGGGPVDFTAGISLAFGDGFVVQSGTGFSAGLDSSLTRLAFVTDDSPAGLNSYKASFRLRLDDLNIGVGDKFPNLSGLSGDGITHFEVRLKRNVVPPENRLLLVAREDDGTIVETPFGQEVMLPAGFNLIEIDWMAGAGTGRLLVSVNGTPFGGLLGLINGQARIDRVRWGVTDGDVDATAGSLDQDDFSSTQ